MTVVVRAAGDRDPATLAQPMRALVRAVDSLVAFNSIATMNEVHERTLGRQRFTSVLVLAFAVTGVALALVGVFGILAQLVQSRWREMGIRLALGAQRGHAVVAALVAAAGLAAAWIPAWRASAADPASTLRDD
jgi:ABC-type antimicrobial peptide transport system permease subunit